MKKKIIIKLSKREMLTNVASWVAMEEGLPSKEYAYKCAVNVNTLETTIVFIPLEDVK